MVMRLAIIGATGNVGSLETAPGKGKLFHDGRRAEDWLV
jgi:hypothetical protein